VHLRSLFWGSFYLFNAGQRSLAARLSNTARPAGKSQRNEQQLNGTITKLNSTNG
jgi:hypothetical protein